MRIVNVENRLCLEVSEGVIDVEHASGGVFSSDPQAVYERWEEFVSWADGYSGGPTAILPEPGDSRLGPPVPRPPQVFAIGLNYRDHVAESGLVAADVPMVFTKFPACITGPYACVEVPPGTVDYEAELVAVIGRRAWRVPATDAWAYVAGLTVGQDISERDMQAGPPEPQQFNLAKSFAGFGPIGPRLVTPDELADPDDLAIGCSLDGVEMQSSRTGKMIFSVPALVEYLSSVVPLLPGDLIFTSTPSGVGWTRKPPQLLRPGVDLLTWVEGIGELRNTFVAAGEDVTPE